MLVRYHMKLRSVCFFFDSYDSKPGRSLVVFHCWSSGSPTLPCTQLHQFDNGGWDTTDVQAISLFCRKMDWGYWRERGRNNNYAVFQTFFILIPPPGEMIQFDEHIFPMGWNHQPNKITSNVFLAFLCRHDISCPENFGTIHHMIRIILYRTFPIICK